MIEEPIAFPTSGRIFSKSFLAGPGETTASGRVRLDTIAHWLQQVAYDHFVDSEIHEKSVWFLRRTAFKAHQFPVFGERITISTAATGFGPIVAERRTSIKGDLGGHIEAAAIWVPINPETMMPARTDEFRDQFDDFAQQRKIRARLNHPAPAPDSAQSTWHFVQADLDVANHVNNAAYLRHLEESLVDHPAQRPLALEIEYRSPLSTGPAPILSSGNRTWVLDPTGKAAASTLLEL